jgi:oligoendopeptidase F
MHRYVALRKKALNFTQNAHVRYVCAYSQGHDKLTEYDDAYNIVLEGLAPLGKTIEKYSLMQKPPVGLT